MKKRDLKGRFMKNEIEERNILTLTFPSLKIILAWLAIIFLIFPWLIIISKFNVFQKIEYIIESLLKENSEDINENGKKSGLFY